MVRNNTIVIDVIVYNGDDIKNKNIFWDIVTPDLLHSGSE